MSVAIVSCLYGDRCDHYLPGWLAAVVETEPTEIIVATDRARDIPGAEVLVGECPWTYPQAYYLDRAACAAGADWIWIVDIDDQPLPDGLRGIEDVEADALIFGYRTIDGDYLPPQLTPSEYLAFSGNPFPAGSMIRTESFRRAGGFRDVAFQDWELWRRMAALEMTFQASDRAHYTYRRHEGSRSATELLPERRERHVEEMLNA